MSHLYSYNTYRGRDFRTSFKSIGGLRALCDAPVIALTATAPYDIQSCICSSLGLSEPVLILHTLDRPNIYLSVCKSKGLPVSKIIFYNAFLVHAECIII